MKEMLIEEAKKARENAYVPYSSFPVGAALMASSGKIYRGCNIESASYSLACCAERTAIFKAISEGEKQFTALAVIADSEESVSPCGACRQVMTEFFDHTTQIYLTNLKGETKVTTTSELLPFAFKL